MDKGNTCYLGERPWGIHCGYKVHSVLKEMEEKGLTAIIEIFEAMHSYSMSLNLHMPTAKKYDTYYWEEFPQHGTLSIVKDNAEKLIETLKERYPELNVEIKRT